MIIPFFIHWFPVTRYSSFRPGLETKHTLASKMVFETSKIHSSINGTLLNASSTLYCMRILPLSEPCTHPDMPPAIPDDSTHNSPGDAAPCISGSSQRPRQQTWPPVWHADDDYRHVNTRSWERRQGCDRGSEAISRHFDVHDPDGELVAQVLLTLDHAPDITSACPNPWSQIYTLDLELPFFEISAAAKDEPRPKGDEIQTSPEGTSATVWGYDVKRGGFHVV